MGVTSIGKAVSPRKAREPAAVAQPQACPRSKSTPDISTAGRKSARSRTCTGLVGTFQLEALAEGEPASRSGMISRNHRRVKNTLVAMSTHPVNRLGIPARRYEGPGLGAGTSTLQSKDVGYLPDLADLQSHI